MLIITVGNMKGGVGKTTLSLMLAKHLAHRGYSVLVIDGDPQGTLSYVLLAYKRELYYDERGRLLVGMPRILEAVEDPSKRELSEEFVSQNIVVIKEPDMNPMWLLPNSICSSKYDLRLMASGKHFSLFRRIIAKSGMVFDVVIIDTPPYTNAFLVAALAVSHVLVVPSETSWQAYPGIEEMLKLTKELSDDGISSLKRLLLVPTKLKNTRTSKEVHRFMKMHYSMFMADELVVPYTELCNKIFSGEITIPKLMEEARKAGENSIYKKLARSLMFLESEAVLPYLSKETVKKFLAE